MTQNKSIFRKNALDYYSNPLPEVVFPTSMRKPILNALIMSVVLLGVIVLYLGAIKIPVYAKGYGKFMENEELKEIYFVAFTDVSSNFSRHQAIWVDCDCFDQPIQAYIAKVGAIESPKIVNQVLDDLPDQNKKINKPKRVLNIEIKKDIAPYSFEKLNGTICNIRIQTGKKNFINLF